MKAIIFDLDGVLINTEYLKANAHVETVNHFDGLTSIDVYKKCIGYNFEVVASTFMNSASINILLEDYNLYFNNIYKKYLLELKRPNNNVYQILKTCKQNNILIGLVTSNEEWILKIIFSKIKIKKFFDCIITGNDTNFHKPSPVPYQMACKRLNIEPHNAIVIEDTRAGLESALGAGIDAYAIRHPLNSLQDLSIANKIYDSLSEIPIRNILQIIE